LTIEAAVAYMLWLKSMDSQQAFLTTESTETAEKFLLNQMVNAALSAVNP
jgi:hypothetical protein